MIELLELAFSVVAPGLSSAWSIALTVFSAVWNFVKRPPGSYIALVLLILLAWRWSGERGYDSGVADTKAGDARMWVQRVDAAKAAGREDGELRAANTRRADLEYAFEQGRTAGAAQSLQSLINQKGAIYVPKIVTADCVPYGLIKLLDAAGLGIADPQSLPGAAGEPDEACSTLSLHDAVSLLKDALVERKDFADRLNNASGWANDQRTQNGKVKLAE